MKASFFLISLIYFTACSNQADQESDKAIKDIDSTSQNLATKDTISGNRNNGSDKDTIPKNIQVDTVIHLAFAKDSKLLEVKGTLNKQSQPVVCYMIVDRKAKLIAHLIPENKNLNLRFSQIIDPDNEADGPFGRQLNYNLVKNGVYKLVIGPNLMADGLRSGDFWIKIEVKETK